MEVQPKELIAAELDTMHKLAREILDQKIVKVFGFTKVKTDGEDSFYITDMSYEDRTYYMVLLEENGEESGVYIRSSLVDGLEIVLPLPQYIRMTNKEVPLFDDLC